MIETRGIDHVVLHVNDPQRSKKFYTAILGMTAYREDSGQVFLHAGQQGVALFKKHGFTDMEVIVGENLTDRYRQALAQQRMEVTAALADLVEMANCAS